MSTHIHIYNKKVRDSDFSSTEKEVLAEIFRALTFASSRTQRLANSPNLSGDKAQVLRLETLIDQAREYCHKIR